MLQYQPECIDISQLISASDVIKLATKVVFMQSIAFCHALVSDTLLYAVYFETNLETLQTRFVSAQHDLFSQSLMLVNSYENELWLYTTGAIEEWLHIQ